jgi:hypothetical protein
MVVMESHNLDCPFCANRFKTGAMQELQQDGTLVYQGAIDDQPTPNHDPRQARNYVREAVDKILAGQKVSVSETKSYGCSVKYGR